MKCVMKKKCSVLVNPARRSWSWYKWPPRLSGERTEDCCILVLRWALTSLPGTRAAATSHTARPGPASGHHNLNNSVRQKMLIR